MAILDHTTSLSLKLGQLLTQESFFFDIHTQERDLLVSLINQLPETGNDIEAYTQDIYSNLGQMTASTSIAPGYSQLTDAEIGNFIRDICKFMAGIHDGRPLNDAVDKLDELLDHAITITLELILDILGDIVSFVAEWPLVRDILAAGRTVLTSIMEVVGQIGGFLNAHANTLSALSDCYAQMGIRNPAMDKVRNAYGAIIGGIPTLPPGQHKQAVFDAVKQKVKETIGVEGDFRSQTTTLELYRTRYANP